MRPGFVFLSDFGKTSCFCVKFTKNLIEFAEVFCPGFSEVVAPEEYELLADHR